MNGTVQTLSPGAQARVDVLRATRPYDGRYVVLMVFRGGWRWTGISGICTRLARDHRSMVLRVRHCPDYYWPDDYCPIGMEILAELDSETVPFFKDLET